MVNWIYSILLRFSIIRYWHKYDICLVVAAPKISEVPGDHPRRFASGHAGHACSPMAAPFWGRLYPCVTCDIIMLQLYTVMCHAMLWYVHDLVGGFTHFLWLSIFIGNNHPNWLQLTNSYFSEGWNYQPVTDYNYYNCRSIDFWPSMTIRSSCSLERTRAGSDMLHGGRAVQDIDRRQCFIAVKVFQHLCWGYAM